MVFPDSPSRSTVRDAKQFPPLAAAWPWVAMHLQCDGNRLWQDDIPMCWSQPYTIPRFRVHPPPIVSTISAFSNNWYHLLIREILSVGGVCYTAKPQYFWGFACGYMCLLYQSLVYIEGDLWRWLDLNTLPFLARARTNRCKIRNRQICTPFGLIFDDF